MQMSQVYQLIVMQVSETILRAHSKQGSALLLTISNQSFPEVRALLFVAGE